MPNLEKYFNNLLPDSKIYLPGGRIVCLKQLPVDSLELYLKGFQHLSLKEDAVELLLPLCEDDLLYLLKLKEGTVDAKIIKKALDMKLGKTAIKKENTKD